VLAPVVEHVDQRVPHFARRPEHPRVISVSPNRAATVEGSVHSLGNPDGETLKAAAKTRRTIRFDEQVHVIALDAELKEPERFRRGGDEG
jgi:hypothetical protein